MKRLMSAFLVIAMVTMLAGCDFVKGSLNQVANETKVRWQNKLDQWGRDQVSEFENQVDDPQEGDEAIDDEGADPKDNDEFGFDLE